MFYSNGLLVELTICSVSPHASVANFDLSEWLRHKLIAGHMQLGATQQKDVLTIIGLLGSILFSWAFDLPFSELLSHSL